MKDSTKYWLKVTAFVALIGATTFFTATYSEAEKVVDFLADQKETLQAEDAALLAATSIANHHDGTDAYVKKEALMQVDCSLPNASMNVLFYAVSSFKGAETTDSLAILIKDLEIDDDAAYTDVSDYHEMHAEITFDRDVSVGNTTGREFDETFITLYDDSAKLILIQYSKLEPYAAFEFETISIGYQLTGGLTQTMVSLDDISLSLLTPNNILLSQTYGETYRTSADIYYSPDLLSRLNSYNIYYLKNFAIELLIVAPLTYFLFFHKRVMEAHRKKKAETLENKTTSTPNVQETIPEERRNPK